MRWRRAQPQSARDGRRAQRETGWEAGRQAARLQANPAAATNGHAARPHCRARTSAPRAASASSSGRYASCGAAPTKEPPKNWMRQRGGAPSGGYSTKPAGAVAVGVGWWGSQGGKHTVTSTTAAAGGGARASARPPPPLTALNLLPVAAGAAVAKLAGQQLLQAGKAGGRRPAGHDRGLVGGAAVGTPRPGGGGGGDVQAGGLSRGAGMGARTRCPGHQQPAGSQLGGLVKRAEPLRGE